VFVAGNLNIAAVQAVDIQDPQLVWRCAIANAIRGVSPKGSKKKIVHSGEPAGDCAISWFQTIAKFVVTQLGKYLSFRLENSEICRKILLLRGDL